jgi:hypothetical protein
MEQAPETVLSGLRARLAAVRRSEDRHAVQRGCLQAGAVVIATCAIATWLEAVFAFEPALRAVLFWSAVIVTAASAGWYACRPLLRAIRFLPGATDAEIAQRVGVAFPDVRDHLANALQLFDERHRTHIHSAAFIYAALQDVERESGPLDFTRVVDRSDLRSFALALAGVGAMCVITFLLFPSELAEAGDRLAHFNRRFTPTPAFRLSVMPGNREVVKGDDVRVTVSVEGHAPASVALASRPYGQQAFDDRTATVGPDQQCMFMLPSLKNNTEYFVFAGNVRSETYALTVVDRPVVKLLRVELHYPAYTRLPMERHDDNVGDISALRGTRADIMVETNKPLAQTSIVLNDGRRIAMRTEGEKASGSLTVAGDGSYHCELEDSLGVRSTEPVTYVLHAIPDAYPTVTILIPGKDVDIAESNSLTLAVRVTDDYGVTRLRLAHRLLHSRYESPAPEFSEEDIPLPPGLGTDGVVSHTWNLKPLHLVPEDVVAYYVRVFDNDAVTGPKDATSQTFTLRLPSMEEVLADVDKAHDGSTEVLQQVLKETQEARKELEQLQQELRKGEQKADWQDRQKAEDLARRYEELRVSVNAATSAIDTMVQEMQKNQVLSTETLEKYLELQQLLEQLSTPEMKEAMRQLQEALQQMNPEAMRQALQHMTQSEENFRKGLERTLNLLKRIQVEQKVEAMLKRIEQMRKEQDVLRERTEAARSGDRRQANDLAREQRDLGKQAEQMKEGTEEIRRRMEEFPTEMPLDAMKDLAAEADRHNIASSMNDAAGQMDASDMQSAAARQTEAQRELDAMHQEWTKVQQGMRQTQQRQVMNDMRRILEDLLDLSRQEEALKNASRGLEQNSQRFRDGAAGQMEVMQNLGTVADRMAALSQKTLAVSPGMGKSMGDAMRSMGEAMQSLDQRNGAATSQQQTEAMASLNAAAEQTQSAMNAMMQGGGQGMGMAGFMQRMQQLSGMQRGINQGTEQLGMTPQQAAAMARLAAEQGMVRKSLEQLAREAQSPGLRDKLLGDLSKIAQEMREVQTDLAQGNVNPRTIEKQERILSRLLDSQKSMRERDFEKKRQAEIGTAQTPRHPPSLDLSTQEGRERLRRDFLKALEEGYARDYEEVIREYFDALERSNQRSEQPPP